MTDDNYMTEKKFRLFSIFVINISTFVREMWKKPSALSIPAISGRNVENAFACSRHFNRKVNRAGCVTEYIGDIAGDARGRVLLFEGLYAEREEREGFHRAACYVLALSRLGFTR